MHCVQCMTVGAHCAPPPHKLTSFIRSPATLEMCISLIAVTASMPRHGRKGTSPERVSRSSRDSASSNGWRSTGDYYCAGMDVACPCMDYMSQSGQLLVPRRLVLMGSCTPQHRSAMHTYSPISGTAAVNARPCLLNWSIARSCWKRLRLKKGRAPSCEAHAYIRVTSRNVAGGGRNAAMDHLSRDTSKIMHLPCSMYSSGAAAPAVRRRAAMASWWQLLQRFRCA